MNQVGGQLKRATFKRMHMQIISALAGAINVCDPYTYGHSRRVAEVSLQLAKVMGLKESFREILEVAAILHDI